MKIGKKYKIYKQKKETMVVLENSVVIFDKKIKLEGGTVVKEDMFKLPRCIKPKTVKINANAFTSALLYINKVLPRQGKTSIHYATEWIYFKAKKGIYYATDIMGFFLPTKIDKDFVMPAHCAEFLYKIMDTIGRMPATFKVEVGMSCTKITFRPGVTLFYETGGEDLAVPSKYRTSFGVNCSRKYKVENFLTFDKFVSEITRFYKKEKYSYVRLDLKNITWYIEEDGRLIEKQKLKHKLLSTPMDMFDIVIPVADLMNIIKYDEDLKEKQKIEIKYGEDAYIYFLDKYYMINHINLIKT